jgi:SAM-dependent methyltransferase
MVAYYAEHTAGGIETELRQSRTASAQTRAYSWLSRRIARAWKHHNRGDRDPGSIADVGAGALELTEALHQQYPDARLTAIDFSFDTVPRGELSRSITLQEVDLNRLEEGDPLGISTYDLVVCVAVMEHVLYPAKLWRYLRRSTREGGMICVMLPDVDSLTHRISGRRWPYYCPDMHLTLPTKKSLRRMAEQSGGGKGQVRIRSFMPRYSLQYLLRYIGISIRLPRSLDFLVPIPAGAVDLIWVGESHGNG